MNLDDFGIELGRIIRHTLLAPGRPIRWTAIVNPKAGGFTIPSRWRRHYAALRSYAEKARENPEREDVAPSKLSGGRGIILTQEPSHASRIAGDLLQEAEETLSASPSPKEAPFYLIICAGGDGTSLETLIALYGAKSEVRDNFAALRLPMGTGNDAADSWDLEGSLDRLILPVKIEKARALTLTTATPGKGPFMAFNILSVGLDAFVTHMTNKMKGKFPGDSYKIWVDIASLLYDRLYRVGPMDIRAFDEEGRELDAFQEKVLLMAVGASGHRTYGAHKKILPDDRNVCLVRQMPLLRKVALKDLFTTGTHVDKPEARLFNAARVEFQGAYPILAQMDGEAILLETKDFPAAIELTEPLIPILKVLP